MVKWIKDNRTEIILILLILLVASFLRFYRLPEYMTFLGDEGRDSLMIQRILVDKDFPLLGPPSSVGNIYLGPLYYYMMAIPMAIFWLNPIAAVFMVGLIGVATVCLIYYLSREWFGKQAAVLSSFLYSISFVAVTYSRSSWNPNPAPFFTLLAFLGLYLARKKRNFLWFILTGASLSAVIQMHYLALILLPVFFILWIFEIFTKGREKYKHFVSGTIGTMLAFLILISPLIIFDFKYNFVNFKGLQSLFTGSNGSLGINILNFPGQILSIYSEKLIGRYIAGENIIVTMVISILVLIPVVLLIKFWSKTKKYDWPTLACGIWSVVSIVGLTFYKYSIYDHYLGFLSPVPFLLLGGFVSLVKTKWQWILVIIILLILTYLNLNKSWLFTNPGNQLSRTQDIARFIIQKANGEPFNFALIAKNNYDSAYQFYLGLYGNKPKVVPVETTSQLFVVCEDPVCNPVVNPKYEIAGFGMSKINGEYLVDGLKIYKLIANPSGEPPE